MQNHTLNVIGSTLASAIRGPNGIVAQPAADKPAELLQLYEFEGCPFCRLVREVLTELDLDAVVYPCPKGGTRFRPEVVELGGKTQFPFLVDPNTGVHMYESADIIEYLYTTYARRAVPLRWRAATLQKFGSTLAGIPRVLAGTQSRTSRMRPERLPELYSFESSPFARVVREALCELEIPYVLRSAGRTTARDWIPPVLRDALGMEPGSTLANRKALLTRAGRITIPYFVDPNTGTELGESREILDYLESTYG